jgi:hypothetical protein
MFRPSGVTAPIGLVVVETTRTPIGSGEQFIVKEACSFALPR